MPDIPSAAGIELHCQVMGAAYPALARVLGPEGLAELAREFVSSHPFFSPDQETVRSDLERVLPEFLEVALEWHPEHADFLPDLVRYEQARARALAKSPCHGPHGSLRPADCHSFSSRIDELYERVMVGAPWEAPRPAELHLAFVNDGRGVHTVELAPDQWAALNEPPGALPSPQAAGAHQPTPE